MAISEERVTRTIIRLCWRDDTTSVSRSDGMVCVENGAVRVTLREPSDSIAAALQGLSRPGLAEVETADRLLDACGAYELTRWYFVLQRLASRGLVVRSVTDRGTPLATLVPVSPAFRLTPTANVGGRGEVWLCRFAYLRRDGERLVLESPRSHARIVFDDPAAVAIVAALSTGLSLAEPPATVGILSGDALAGLLGLLADAGMLTERGSDEENDPLRTWEFHDLLFHARSRKGRWDAPFGATYRPDVQVSPPVAVKPEAHGERFPLVRPDLAQLRAVDPPLAAVMEERHSLRIYDERPIAIERLGEFLFRVARIREAGETMLETPRGALRVEFASRPYPSGGALYELDFYVAANQCNGLPSGLYRYDGQEHCLIHVPCAPADQARLLSDAAASAGISAESVQVLVIVTARFQRLSWKYASIAYALILKHVGVVYQSMYLAATAMDLAPCALGGGDSDLFARAAGLDYYAETSVGEFLLGSRPRVSAK
jgi:SagB-type dehydrogenase family enzyme